MNRFFTVLLMIGFLVALFTNEKLIYSFHKIKTHQIKTSEFFNKLSFKNYGTPNYGKELALINQAVKLKPGSTEYDMIIPSIDAIRRLYETYDISKAENILKNLLWEQDEKSFSPETNFEFLKSSLMSPFIIISIILSLIIGYILGRKKSSREIKLAKLKFNPKDKDLNITDEGEDLETIRNKDEFIINFKQK